MLATGELCFFGFGFAAALLLDLLAFHISNRFIDLRPILHTFATESGHTAITIDWDNPPKDSVDHDPSQSGSRWILITKNERFLEDKTIVAYTADWPERARFPLAWTDDFGSIWQVLKSRTTP